MQTVVDKSFPHLLTWLVGVSVILFCMAGIAALMGWIPASFGNLVASPSSTSAGMGGPPSTSLVVPKARMAPVPATQGAQGVASGTRCADCGVVESTRVVDTPGDGSALGVIGGAVAGTRYETTVRFDDGSTRVFVEATRQQWRAGDRIRMFDGAMRLQG